MHAATKYIGGHSDVLSGLILASEATFPALHRLWTDMGVTASSDDSFLALRGLRTLPLRLARHVDSALEIAQWLKTRPEVREVIYPALPARAATSCGSAISSARRDCSRSCSNPWPRRASTRCSTACGLFCMGWSWGGFESLIIPTYPERVQTATTWDAGGPCLRLAIGLEDPGDLIADLSEGLARLSG